MFICIGFSEHIRGFWETGLERKNLDLKLCTMGLERLILRKYGTLISVLTLDFHDMEISKDMVYIFQNKQALLIVGDMWVILMNPDIAYLELESC